MRPPADFLDRIQGAIDVVMEALRPPRTRSILVLLIFAIAGFSTRDALFVPLAVGHGAARAVVQKEKLLKETWRDTVELQQAADYFEDDGKQFAREVIFERMAEDEVKIVPVPQENGTDGSTGWRKKGWLRDRESRAAEKSRARGEVLDRWMRACPIPRAEEMEQPETIAPVVSEDRLRELIEKTMATTSPKSPGAPDRKAGDSKN